ncbi:DNA topoisomerase IB [Psychrobacter pygoscelis]|uniref:DNA topoisomerase IB n=1 Tax=Psychrobacter pygoscelis TaxID=2488563 RepID=UPI001A955189|nr:DNA topoisomerase IB [Psychrobacter pygoscelis]
MVASTQLDTLSPATMLEPSLRHDYETLARQAKLRYVSDEEPGFSRQRWGRGFTYKDALGNTVKDKKLRRRFEALVIPPMWSEVWICEFENGHLQCTGRDDKGRKQYIYHELWDSVRDRAKFDAVIGFGEALPTLRAQIEQDLDSEQLSRRNVLAAVVKLLETTLIRVGNDRYAKENSSYGLSTLRSKHVSETEEGLAFDFVGKSAKTHHIELQDERLIDIVQACSELPGYRIFKYIDEQGVKQVVDSSDVNDYLRQHTGHEYSAKDFRTWMASVLAASYLYQQSDEDTRTSEPGSKQREQCVVDMVKAVADKLGNTPSVCRASYIHPKVIESFLAASFIDGYKRARSGRTRSHQHVDEKALLAFLKSH